MESINNQINEDDNQNNKQLDNQEVVIDTSPKKHRVLWKKILKIFAKATLYFFAITFLWTLLLKWLPVPFTFYMAQEGVSGYFSEKKSATIYYDWASLDKISPALGVAVMASEDQNFPTHNGFDFDAIEKAIENNKHSTRKMGASTISQQVAKNVFLWQGRNYLRKGLEVYFTVLIETLWSKERILEVYLNVAEMGQNTFGVQAASRRFFGKEAKNLSFAEAARLAAVLPNPKIYSAENPTGYVLQRQAQIQWQMTLLGGTSYLERLK
jgi:monofunctional glycosyltransferase